MNNALAQIFNIQQQAINDQKKRQELAQAKRNREITAFQNSELPNIFRAIADVPVRNDVRQRIYKSIFGDTTWDHCDPRKNRRVSEIVCCNTNGSGSGPRWYCVESPDTGRIKYGYNDGVSYKNNEEFDASDGLWLNLFLEYAAKICDPAAIAQKVTTTTNETTTETPRRRLQKI